MVFPDAVLPKVAARWLFTFYRAARKLRRHAFQLYYRNTAAKPPPPPSSTVSQQQQQAGAATATACFKTGATIPDAAGRTVVCDMHGALLRSTALFPYFMLVACEGGSLLRAMLLLCAFPLVWALGSGAGVRLMAFVTFAGLTSRDVDLVARAVMPKHYMEQLNSEVYGRLWLPARRKVAVTAAPRVMSEWFLKEYMAADAVVGLELQHVTVGRRRYFTGLLAGPATEPELRRHKALREALGAEDDDPMADVGIISHSSQSQLDQLFVPYCKVRAYMHVAFLFLLVTISTR